MDDRFFCIKCVSTGPCVSIDASTLSEAEGHSVQYNYLLKCHAPADVGDLDCHTTFSLVICRSCPAFPPPPSVLTIPSMYFSLCLRLVQLPGILAIKLRFSISILLITTPTNLICFKVDSQWLRCCATHAKQQSQVHYASV